MATGHKNTLSSCSNVQFQRPKRWKKRQFREFKASDNVLSSKIRPYILVLLSVYFQRKDNQHIKYVCVTRNKNIMLTCPCNFDPFTSHFHRVKFGFTLFLFCGDGHKTLDRKYISAFLLALLCI